MKRLALLIVAAVLLAGCGEPRVVHVTDPRAKIHDNARSVRAVRANFAGKPADITSPSQGWQCEMYGSPQKVIDDPELGPAWIVQLCYRLPTE